MLRQEDVASNLMKAELAEVTSYEQGLAAEVGAAARTMSQKEAMRVVLLWSCLKSKCGVPARFAVSNDDSPYRSWTGGCVAFMKATTRETRRALEEALPDESVTGYTDAAFEAVLRKALGPEQEADLDAELKYGDLIVCRPPGIDNGLTEPVRDAYKEGPEAYKALPYATKLKLLEEEIERRGGIEKVNEAARSRYEERRKAEAARPIPSQESMDPRERGY